MDQNRLHLGGKEDGIESPLADKQRLFAKPVARHEHTARPFIPNGKSEHSVQPQESCFAPLSEGGKQDLRVAACLEDMAKPYELTFQFKVIVYFPVEGNSQRTVGRRHGLICRVRNIDDRQTPMREPNPPPVPNPVRSVVGAPVNQSVSHRRQEVVADGHRRRNHAHKAAHLSPPHRLWPRTSAAAASCEESPAAAARWPGKSD
ncbi:MAG: hypothetical protein AW07_00892 [Candidatus Accumulibacter sp. SK-11]|nr:MAG: hypothetical protein AW07_00892 [Candidatus Accumulibacter sp. SK-11]